MPKLLIGEAEDEIPLQKVSVDGKIFKIYI
jgi:hypothetical protein